MLRVQSISKAFEGFQAVSEAHLHVAPGEIVAVIGPNGAGKTTLFNLITGILKPDAGKVWFKNQEITGHPPHRIFRRGIARSFQLVNIFQRQTVLENVRVAVLARQRKTRNLFTPAHRLALRETNQILEDVRLIDKRNRIAGLLSHGDQKVLEIAMALGGEPELLILDEPTAGMSPEETTQCITLIREISQKRGLTILFCEHDMEIVFGIAQRILVMIRGKTILQGTVEEVKANREVQEAYLGENA